jgi:hypothetical protein
VSRNELVIVSEITILHKPFDINRFEFLSRTRQ